MPREEFQAKETAVDARFERQTEIAPVVRQLALAGVDVSSGRFGASSTLFSDAPVAPGAVGVQSPLQRRSRRALLSRTTTLRSAGKRFTAMPRAL
jgi:hypothetical protein